MSFRREPVNYDLTLGRDLADLLDRMADVTDQDHGDVVAKSLMLFAMAVDSGREGKRLVLIDDATGEREEIVGLGRAAR